MNYKILILIVITFSIPSFGQTFPVFKVNTIKIDGKNNKREGKMKQALAIFEKVMNDESFQSELKTLKFEFDVDDDPNRTLSTQEIVEKIYDAKEHYNTEENNTADIYWFAKRRSFFDRFTKCSVLGYGNEDKSEIYSYTCFVDDNELSEVVGHIAHEWTHKIGFTHQFEDNDKRDDTVPYSFGYLVRKHSKKYI